VVALLDRTVSEFGGVDVLVNNAAIYPVKASLDLSLDEWDEVHSLNLRAVFLACREAARRMIPAGRGGVIVNIASVSGFRGRPKMAAYVGSKHGVVGITKSLAAEWGPHGIRVLGIAPPLVDTPGMAAWQKSERAQTNTESVSVEKLVTANLPLGRIGVPDDIARVALFCASDMSALMTGSTLAVDAGLMCY
jgi:NAD(P)-dependent dehydrogenase (short-subunit alcohol dehydrogenase family)